MEVMGRRSFLRLLGGLGLAAVLSPLGSNSREWEELQLVESWGLDIDVEDFTHKLDMSADAMRDSAAAFRSLEEEVAFLVAKIKAMSWKLKPHD